VFHLHSGNNNHELDWGFIPGGEMVNWQHNPLTKAIFRGHFGVIDLIDSALVKASERLNGLLNQKKRSSDMFLDIPEPSREPRINYHCNLQPIATCTSPIRLR
jgi:hypothetical protein